MKVLIKGNSNELFLSCFTHSALYMYFQAVIKLKSAADLFLIALYRSAINKAATDVLMGL